MHTLNYSTATLNGQNPENFLEGFGRFLENNFHSPSTIKNYASDIRSFLQWIKQSTSQSIDIQQNITSNTDEYYLSPAMFTVYIHSLGSKKNSPSLLKRRKAALRLFYSYYFKKNLSSPKPLAQYQQLLEEFTVSLSSSGATQKTIQNYISDTRQFLAFGNKNSSNQTTLNVRAKPEIDAKTIQAYKESLYSTNSIRTRSRKISSLHKFIGWLREKDEKSPQNSTTKIAEVHSSSNPSFLQSQQQSYSGDLFRGSITLPPRTTAIFVSKNWQTAPQAIIVTPTYNTNVWITDLDPHGFTINFSRQSSKLKTIFWFAVW